MPPRFPLEDEQDVALTHAKPLCQTVERNLVRLVHGPDFFNQFCCEFGCASPLSNRRVKPAFLHAVPHVVRVSAGKEMCGIYARWIVALVADLVAFWNNVAAVMPRKAMRQLWIRALSIFVPTLRMRNKPSVSVMGFVTSPKPAILRTSHGDLFPKSLFGWSLYSHTGYVTSFQRNVNA